MSSDLPPWLPRAWKVRAVLLTLILGLLTLAVYGQRAEGDPTAWLVLALGAIFIGAGLAADWYWLKRNHHRVNEWGLSKGKDARKKPK